MATNYLKPGDTMTITAGSTFASGDAVQIGKAFGVALTDIASGEVGEIGLVGVYSLPKNAPLVISQGDRLFWDTTPGELNKTATAQEGVGFAYAAALSADATVLVRLDGGSTITAL